MHTQGGLGLVGTQGKHPGQTEVGVPPGMGEEGLSENVTFKLTAESFKRPHHGGWGGGRSPSCGISMCKGPEARSQVSAPGCPLCPSLSLPGGSFPLPAHHYALSTSGPTAFHLRQAVTRSHPVRWLRRRYLKR